MRNPTAERSAFRIASEPSEWYVSLVCPEWQDKNSGSCWWMHVEGVSDPEEAAAIYANGETGSGAEHLKAGYEGIIVVTAKRHRWLHYLFETDVVDDGTVAVYPYQF